MFQTEELAATEARRRKPPPTPTLEDLLSFLEAAIQREKQRREKARQVSGSHAAACSLSTKGTAFRSVVFGSSKILVSLKDERPVEMW